MIFAHRTEIGFFSHFGPRIFNFGWYFRGSTSELLCLFVCGGVVSDSYWILCHTCTSYVALHPARRELGMSDSVSDLSGGVTQAPERQRGKEGGGTGEAEGAKGILVKKRAICARNVTLLFIS